MGFDYKLAFDNWSTFLSLIPGYHEINLVVNTSEDNTLEVVKQCAIDYRKQNVVINVIESNIQYSDPAFDGKIKDIGFQASTGDINILLDLDEACPLYTSKSWYKLGQNLLEQQDFDGFLIPSIDLFGKFENATGVGQKWYMVKNKSCIHRGVFAGAIKENGTFRIDVSDSTEPLYPDGNLIKSAHLFDQSMNYEQKLQELKTGKWPFVFHLGSLNIDQRIKQNEYWSPVWNLRAGEEVTNIKTKKEQFDNISTFEHSLKHWSEK
jgi:hypothetical protein